MRYLFLLTGLMIGCNDQESSTSKSIASSPSTKVEGDVLATVNGQQIGSAEFTQQASRKSPSDGKKLNIDERKEVLDKLVVEELLYQKALANGYDKDPKVKKVMVNALLREEVYGSIKNGDFSDEELKAYFSEHEEEFVTPEKVQIYSILIKVNDDRSDQEAKDKADRIYKELRKDPSKFREVAGAESENPYKRRGGDVGFVPETGKPGLDSAVVERAFSMKVETLSEPFKTMDGYNVIYIAAKRERDVRSFDKMKGSVLRKVKNERLKENYDNYTGALKTGSQVTVDEVSLGNVEISSSPKPSLQMPNGMQLGGGR